MPTNLQNLNFASDEDIWAELTVDKLPANTDGYNNSSGTSTANGASVTVSYAPDGNLLTPPGYAVNAYDLEVDYPIASDGSYPDVEMTFQIGNKTLSRMVLTGGYERNMYPPIDRTVPRTKRVALSESIRKLLNLMQKGMTVRNLPLRIAGFQIPAQVPFQVTFKSTVGWGTVNAAIRPLKVRFRGDILTDEALGEFQLYYNQQNTFRISREPNGSVQGQHMLPGTLDSTSIDMLPNGTRQQGPISIYRKITHATNNNAITTKSPYIFSTQSAVGGQTQNVANTIYDLGFPYAGTNKIFIPYEYGIDFASSLLGVGKDPEIFISWYKSKDRTTVPNMHAHGLRVKASRNKFQWGAGYPQVDAKNLQFPLQSALRFVSMLVNRENWALAVDAESLGSGFNAGDIDVAIGGIEIE